jgi:thioredoxin-dependent peroxiredoxin
MEIIEIKEGTKAPGFILMGSDNQSHSLSDYRGKKVILFFYPKDNTPGWTNEATSFKDGMTELESLNAVPIGISRDKVATHIKFSQKYELPYVLLSDNEEEVCNLYGVLKEKNMYGKKVIGIERSTFIINEEGYIEKIFRKVKVPGHVEEIIKSIR